MEPRRPERVLRKQGELVRPVGAIEPGYLELRQRLTASLDLDTVLSTLKIQLNEHIHVPAGLLLLFDNEKAAWRMRPSSM